MDVTETGMGKGEWEIEKAIFLLIIDNATYFSQSDYRYLNFFSAKSVKLVQQTLLRSTGLC